MAKHNPVHMALRYQCRHDTSRRFLKPQSCEKAPLKNYYKDFDGEITKECRACPGPVDLYPNDGEIIMETKDFHDEALPVPVVDTPPPVPQPVPEPASEAETKAPLCKKCGVNPCLIRKDGISLGMCPKCKSECMQNAQVAKAANKTSPDYFDNNSISKTREQRAARQLAILEKKVKELKQLPLDTPEPADRITPVAALPSNIMTLLRDIDICWYSAKIKGEPLNPDIAEVLVTGSAFYKSHNESKAND